MKGWGDIKRFAALKVQIGHKPGRRPCAGFYNCSEVRAGVVDLIGFPTPKGMWRVAPSLAIAQFPHSLPDLLADGARGGFGDRGPPTLGESHIAIRQKWAGRRGRGAVLGPSRRHGRAGMRPPRRFLRYLNLVAETCTFSKAPPHTHTPTHIGDCTSWGMNFRNGSEADPLRS